MFEVTKACGAFMKLLEEQLDRVAGMKDEKTDFTTKKCVTIGIIDGDGIGPIITKQASVFWRSCSLMRSQPEPSSCSISKV